MATDGAPTVSARVMHHSATTAVTDATSASCNSVTPRHRGCWPTRRRSRGSGRAARSATGAAATTGPRPDADRHDEVELPGRRVVLVERVTSRDEQVCDEGSEDRQHPAHRRLEARSQPVDLVARRDLVTGRGRQLLERAVQHRAGCVAVGEEQGGDGHVGGRVVEVGGQRQQGLVEGHVVADPVGEPGQLRRDLLRRPQCRTLEGLRRDRGWNRAGGPADPPTTWRWRRRGGAPWWPPPTGTAPTRPAPAPPWRQRRRSSGSAPGRRGRRRARRPSSSCSSSTDPGGSVGPLISDAPAAST